MTVYPLPHYALADEQAQAARRALKVGAAMLGLHAITANPYLPSDHPETRGLRSGIEVGDIPARGGKLAGFVDPAHGGAVWFRADLSAREVAVTVAHELRHLWAQRPPFRITDHEGDAETFGRLVANLVLPGIVG